MNTINFLLPRIIFLGIGATLTFDVWTWFLNQTFKIKPSNMCLVGRWVRYMPEGIFWHANITSVPAKPGECIAGWLAHYAIGVIFAIGFTVLVGDRWFESPKLLPALVFGILTVSAPFLIMQPALGLGIAGSKTANPTQTRLRSLMNHAAFGIGLYLFGLLADWLS